MAERAMIANSLQFQRFYYTISYPFAMKWSKTNKNIVATHYASMLWYLRQILA